MIRENIVMNVSIGKKGKDLALIMYTTDGRKLVCSDQQEIWELKGLFFKNEIRLILKKIRWKIRASKTRECLKNCKEFSV